MEEVVKALDGNVIRNAVGDLLLACNGMTIDQIKATIDTVLVAPDLPNWLVEANISARRKKLIKDTIVEARNSTSIYQINLTKDRFEYVLEEIAKNTSLSDDIVEEILRNWLEFGFDGYKLELDKGFDYDHLHQVLLGIENGVNIMDDIDNDTPIMEVIKIRLQKQYEKSHPVVQEVEVEDVQKEGDNGSPE